jgi:ferredoxin-type protein NapF
VVDPRRRLFLRGSLRQAAAAEAPPAPPRPPWALSPDAAFTAACTRCGDCARACPHALIRAGDGGFPVIDFSRHGCDTCGACRQACTHGALAADGPPFTWRVQVADTCLARRQVECRVCAEACDARALRFRPAPGGVWQLQIDPAACTGCGDCVSPCPVGAVSMARPGA